ncbi:MAG: hypothetical protein HQ559_10770, partial [Lentisphaerae bacterium]|nr:hypothetical protein [Lentisphaerota bacterium]
MCRSRAVSLVLLVSALLVVGAGQVAGASAKTGRVVVSLSEDVSESSVGLDPTGSAVFTGVVIAGEPGEPALPIRRVRVLLPPDADPRTVTARIADEIIEELKGSYDVDPVPPVAV